MGYDKLVTLAERCAKYAAACGKKSILETKPIGKVDVSKLGVCLSDGSVHFPNNFIRYRTTEEAENAMRKIISLQYDVTETMQKEINVSICGKDLYIGKSGVDGSSCVPHTSVRAGKENLPHRVFDEYHNHPYHAGQNEFPLSNADIYCLILDRSKSITAFNHRGEYNTARIVDYKKFLADASDLLDISCRILPFLREKEIIMSMGKEGERLLELRKLSKEKNLNNVLKDELNQLELKFETFDRTKFMYEHPEEHSIILHRLYKKYLPQFGIEYETNFSNLLKYDA